MNLKKNGVSFAARLNRLTLLRHLVNGESIFQIRTVFTELKRNIIRERTIARMQAVRARGVKIGRPRKLSLSQVAMANERMPAQSDIEISVIALDLGLSLPTLMRAMARAQ